MVITAAILGPVIPDALGNILMAAVISTPAALAIAALMVPFRPDPAAAGELAVERPPAPPRGGWAGDRRPAGQLDGCRREGHAGRHRVSAQHCRKPRRHGRAR